MKTLPLTLVLLFAAGAHAEPYPQSLCTEFKKQLATKPFAEAFYAAVNAAKAPAKWSGFIKAASHASPERWHQLIADEAKAQGAPFTCPELECPASVCGPAR